MVLKWPYFFSFVWNKFIPPSGWLELFADNHTLVQYFLFGSNAKILSELGFTPSVSLKNSSKLFSLSPATVQMVFPSRTALNQNGDCFDVPTTEKNVAMSLFIRFLLWFCCSFLRWHFYLSIMEPLSTKQTKMHMAIICPAKIFLKFSLKFRIKWLQKKHLLRLGGLNLSIRLKIFNLGRLID